MRWEGDKLKSLRQRDGKGVYIDTFLASDTNTFIFTDDSGTERSFPFIAPLTIQIGAALQADAAAKVWVFMEDPDGTPDGDEWGTTGAVILQDNLGASMTQLIGGAASLTYNVEYDNVNQAGHTPGTDINVRVVAIGLSGAGYVNATGVIKRASENIVVLDAPSENSYEASV